MTRNALVFAFLVPTLLMSSAASAGEHERDDFLKRYERLENRLFSIASAMTAKQFDWRPADGVRSLSEAYRHLTVAHYKLVSFMGTPIPKGIDLEAIDKETDRKKVMANLKASYDHARAVIGKLSNDDMSRETPVWGKPGTVRFAVLLVVAHSAEHLGQAIAYARMNGVVPPWSKKK